MKPKYTVIITNNETGKQILDFDVAHVNYKIKTDILNGHFIANFKLDCTCLLDKENDVKDRTTSILEMVFE